jgi:hypothetical protein
VTFNAAGIGIGEGRLSILSIIVTIVVNIWITRLILSNTLLICIIFRSWLFNIVIALSLKILAWNICSGVVALSITSFVLSTKSCNLLFCVVNLIIIVV